MLTLKNYQREAVEELKKKCVKLLNMQGKRHKLIFKAPTGAGKTVMASALLDDMVNQVGPSGDCQYGKYAFIWLSPNKLHLQSYLSVRNFFTETRSLHPVMWSDINPNEGLNGGEVLFLNWQSINKDNAILIRDNETNTNLANLVNNTRHKQNLPIIAVIDEEHFFATDFAKQSENALKLINPDLEIRISATPKSKAFDDMVTIHRSEVIEEEMIKESVCLNPNVRNNSDDGLTVNVSLLKQALDKRNELAKMYKEVGSLVNPLLLIQLPNDTKETLSADEQTLKTELEIYLKNEYDITTENGRLAVWLSNEKKNIEGLEAKDNLCEVLLFKQAIALGWDCPRAHVLLIFRDLKDVDFTTQTVGRILRMPELRHYTRPELNTGFVYTNLSADIVKIASDDMDYLSTIVAQRRTEVADLQMPSVFIDRRLLRNRLTSKINDILRKKFVKYFDTDTEGVFQFETEEEGGNSEENRKENSENSILTNRQKAAKKGLRMDVKTIMVEIPKDTQLPNEDEGYVEVVKKQRMAVTQGELRALLVKFCRAHIASLAPADSVGILRTALINIMEEFFGFIEDEAIKVILHNENRNKFAALVDDSIKEFISILAVKDKDKNNKIKQVDFVWELPKSRVYNLQAHISTEGKIWHHALQPYFEEVSVSIPEKHFAELLDQDDHLLWWYKNGDNGKQHFAVPYTNKKGELHAFYVDFIAVTEPDSKGVSTICLFDTKTEGSDEDAVEKHNALIDYINQWNNPVVTDAKDEKDEAIKLKALQKNTRMVGGVIIENTKTPGNWYYSPLHINTTDNYDGWTLLDFDRIKKGE